MDLRIFQLVVQGGEIFMDGVPDALQGLFLGIPPDEQPGSEGADTLTPSSVRWSATLYLAAASSLPVV